MPGLNQILGIEPVALNHWGPLVVMDSSVVMVMESINGYIGEGNSLALRQENKAEIHFGWRERLGCEGPLIKFTRSRSLLGVKFNVA